VIVPPRAGVLSAVGLLESPRRRELVRSWAGDADPGTLATELGTLADEVRRQVGDDAVVETALDCRYVGQSHEITVTDPADFPAAHAQRNGYARPGAPVEVVALRARATSPVPLTLADLAAPDRSPTIGPAVIAEPDCTVYVPPGWRATPGPLGELVLRRDA
jgi:N-methylhydantoinase A/oxoprolinase/acetone carboxylase beta subunit